jgi:hypothetical protein
MTTRAMAPVTSVGFRLGSARLPRPRGSRSDRLIRHLRLVAGAAWAVLSSSACQGTPRTEPAQAPPASQAPAVSEAALPIEKKAEDALTAIPSAIPGKPIFDVRLDIEGCPHDVYVNGGLVERNLAPNAAHIEYQINHYLRSGSNELEVQLIRMSDEPVECDVKVALRWRDESAPADVTPVTLLTLVHDAKTAPANDATLGSSPSGTFDPMTGLPREGGALHVSAATLAPLAPAAESVRVLRRSFELPLSFPEWAYLRSDRMTLEHEFQNEQQQTVAYEALLARYNELHALLEKGDLDAFIDACEERSREIDIAYYKAPGSTRRALDRDLKKAMADQDFELADLYRKPGKPWGYFVGSQGTLAMLYQGFRASTIFRYQMKDGTAFSLVFPVMFRKEGSKFIVTR